MGLSDESEAEDSTKRDPDWVETPISPETPMVPCQRRFQRRTRSTEASSSLIKNSESVQVREKNCFKILIKKSSRAPYLFLQNTPRTEYWRIWKSWVLMFESDLLIPNGSFCGKRLKNKNKKLRCRKKSDTERILQHSFAWARKKFCARNMCRAFRSISRFLKDLSDSSGSK